MVREALLAGAWYPDKLKEISKMIDSWTDDVEPDSGYKAGIVPHAGWVFSGRISARIIGKFKNKKIFFVIGGHLAPGSSILAAAEEAVYTPLGTLVNRLDIISDFKSSLVINEDRFSDNTVEIVLPMIKYLHPDAEIVWLRAPADKQAVELADLISGMTEKYENIAVIGSTDLTHYGYNYSFTPHGNGADALAWVKEQNDKEIIDLLLKMKYMQAINHAAENRSACSAGAAAAAARFAENSGVNTGKLEDYSTSYDVHPSDSFVGYAGIIY